MLCCTAPTGQAIRIVHARTDRAQSSGDPHDTGARGAFGLKTSPNHRPGAGWGAEPRRVPLRCADGTGGQCPVTLLQSALQDLSMSFRAGCPAPRCDDRRALPALSPSPSWITQEPGAYASSATEPTARGSLAAGRGMVLSRIGLRMMQMKSALRSPAKKRTVQRFFENRHGPLSQITPIFSTRFYRTIIKLKKWKDDLGNQLVNHAVR